MVKAKKKPTITKVGKWGNTLAFRIPKNISQESQVHVGSELSVRTESTMDGRLRIILEEVPQANPLTKERMQEIDESLTGIVKGYENVTDEEIQQLKIQGRLKKYGLLD